MFAINYRDSRPIYEQIMDELRKMIISGVFAPDEKLPSVRELAQLLPSLPERPVFAAGCTDLLAQANPGVFRPACLVSLLETEELKRITAAEGRIRTETGISWTLFRNPTPWPVP